MSKNLKSHMIHALTWSSVDRFGQQIVQFIIGIILARILSPTDYGLIGMLMIFIALSSTLVDGGFGQALIRKQNTTSIDFNTIFLTNLSISLVLYLTLFFSAPLIASFFNQKDLIKISRVLFISILFHAVYFIPYVKIVKKLAYKQLSKINITSTIISGILGVYLAFNGFKVWALVYQQLSYHFFRLILFYYYQQWKPSFSFSFNVIKEHWKFSIHLLSTSLLNVVFNNIYLVIIGKSYPLKQVGYYTQANKLNETVNYSFQQILQGTSFPLLVQIQNEHERYRRVYRKITKTIALFIFPLILSLVIMAEPLIISLLSEKWRPAIPFFQLLCLANIFTPFFGLNISALNSRGESKKTLQLELIKKGLILLSIIFSYSYGIKTMLIGFILANLVAYLFSMSFIKKNLKYYYKHQFIDIIYSLISAFIISSLLYLLKARFLVEMNSWIQLFILSSLVISIYLATLYIFNKKQLFLIIKQVKKQILE